MTFIGQRHLAFCCAVLAGTASGLLVRSANGQQQWTQAAAPTSQDLWSVCYGDRYVAVGIGGTILTSPDGQTWTAQQSGTANWLVAVRWDGRQYLAVGDQGIILTSPDGVTWTKRFSGGPRLNGIAITHNGFAPANLLYVAVGEAGATVTSTDAITWTSGSAGVPGWLHGIAAGNVPSGPGVEVVGQGGTILSVPYSAAGINSFWALASGTTADLEDIAYGWYAGIPDYVAVGAGGAVLRSLDMVSWSAVNSSTTAHLYAVAQYSATPNPLGATTSGSIAVGEAGTILVRAEPGGTPVAATSPTTQGLLGIAVGPGLAVAVGQQGTILTSQLTAGAPVATQTLAPYSNGILGPTGAVFGATIQLTPFVSGWAPLSYQWSFNGQPIPGATSATLTLTNVQFAQNGGYTVQVRNAVGATTLGPFTLQAGPKASIPGLVDESFNPVMPGPPAGVAPQPDGKLVVTGDAFGFGSVHRFGRLNADGSPDTAFNAAAAAAPPFLSTPWPTVQADGKILLVATGGDSLTVPPQSVRLNSDGSVDATYSPHVVLVNGVAVEDALPSFQLADGEYLSFPNPLSFLSSEPQVARRLNPDGSLDPTYPTWNPGTTAALPPHSFDSLGRIWVNRTRLNADGTPDASLPAELVIPQGLFDGIEAMASQGDKMLMVAQGSFGGGTAPLSGWFGPLRYNSDGTVDSSYLAQSVPALQFSWGPAAIGPDGSAYLLVMPDYGSGGLTVPAGGPTRGFLQGSYRNGLVRFDPSGAFDPSFSLNLTPDPLPGVFPGGLVFQGTNQVLIWGDFTWLNGEPHPYLARLNLASASQVSRLGNVSTRAYTGTGAQALAAGFVVGGTGSLPVLVRGIGPSLAAFGLSNFLGDPQLTLFNGMSTPLVSNDNWNSVPTQAAAIQTAEAAAGAFALTSSLDAAALATLPAGNYSFQVTGQNGGTGIALAEAYDLTSGAPPYGASRLVNISTRALTAPGAQTLTAGFVVGGANLKRVLIRAVGPGLVNFGVPGTLADPEISVFSGSNLVAFQSGSPALDVLPASTATGAFALSAGDTALCLTLGPGAYTVQASSVSGASGIVLLEIYEVP
jgi:uncharacterized delta-60 repeat protein